jgi:phosphoglucosamine mutase
MIFKIGKAAARFALDRIGANPANTWIIIGRDTRLSCEKIEKLLAVGISAHGVKTILTDTISTPGLAFLTRRFKAALGLMISASHNDAKDNGIKFFSAKGSKQSTEEEKLVEEMVLSEEIPLGSLPPYDPTLVFPLEDGEQIYIDCLKSKAGDLDLKGIKIALDCANGALCHIAPAVLEELGAEVIAVNSQQDGSRINLNSGALYPENIAKLVVEHKADIGIAYDGDGDRAIMTDEQGNLVDGDHIMAIIGRHLLQSDCLPKNTLVTTVMSNYGLQEAIESAGGRLIRTDVGDRYVFEALLKENLIFGGEQSGHIIFLNHSNTGDAMITVLEILKVVRETRQKLSVLAQCMRKHPQVLVNVRVKEKKPFDDMPQVNELISRYNTELLGVGRLLVRYSGTEPLARIMVEGRDHQLIQDIAESLAKAIEVEIGIKQKDS